MWCVHVLHTPAARYCGLFGLYAYMHTHHCKGGIYACEIIKSHLACSWMDIEWTPCVYLKGHSLLDSHILICNKWFILYVSVTFSWFGMYISRIFILWVMSENFNGFHNQNEHVTIKYIKSQFLFQNIYFPQKKSWFNCMSKGFNVRTQ